MKGCMRFMLALTLNHDDLPELLKPEVARQLQELLDMGFIRKSTSAMASPIVCVLKGRNGENGVRLCCDYRYLNKYTSGDAYPTPDITDVIHKVGKAQWISSWDIRSGYWHLCETIASLAHGICYRFWII